MATDLRDAIDAGSGAGYLEIYDGSMPSNLGAITTQTKLATLTFSDPCGTVSGGTLTFSAITGDSAADASGTATWGRLYDSNATVIGDFDVGTVGAFLNLNTVGIVVGGPIAVSSFAVTVG
jgi:hypothetical protein